MMDSSRSSSSSPRPRLPAHIVEDHHQALPVIYRAIGSKTLPYDSTTLIHFDAHPDLLSPNIKAEQLTDTTKLFSHIDIADWILPAVYMGHVTCVVWVKPPWADQIADGEYPLIIGKDSDTGLIRLATPLSYFISELLCVPKEQLENMREIPLLVVTVTTSSTTLFDGNRLSCCRNVLKARKDDTLPPPSKHPRLLFEGGIAKKVRRAKAWILDFDLDFFSTGNPYRGPFSPEQYECLRELYQTPVVDDPSNEQEVLRVVCERRQLLVTLRSLWSCDDLTTQKFLPLSGEQWRAVEEIRGFLGRRCNNFLIDQEFVHTCGLLTELPLHVSSEKEVGQLVEKVTQLLEDTVQSWGPPTLITIARSSVDEYTPPTQVDHLQHLLVSALAAIECGELDIHSDYLEEQQEDPRCEPPGRICDCSYL